MTFLDAIGFLVGYTVGSVFAAVVILAGMLLYRIYRDAQQGGRNYEHNIKGI